MMKDKVVAFIKENQMIQSGDHIVIGLSGGADSVCLLLLLHELCGEWNLRLSAVYVEHGIRGEESVADGAFAKNLCAKLGIQFYMRHVAATKVAKKQHLSIEEAARFLRYDVFGDVCRQVHGTKIAVAHHAEDCAETMIFHLARGTGLRGLIGIRPVRDVIIRPLLCVTRIEIEAYLKEHNQSYVEDATNQSVDYSRNRIRHHVLPELEMINTKSSLHMVQTANMLYELESYLQEEVQKVFHRTVRFIEEKDEVMIPIEAFFSLHPYMQKEIIQAALAQMAKSRKDIAKVHVQDVCTLFDAQRGKRITLPYSMCAEREGDCVCIYREKEGIESGESSIPTTLQIPGKTVLSNKFVLETELFLFDGDMESIPQNPYTKWFDYDTIKVNVNVRFRESGDYFIMKNPAGKKQLKSYFIDEKISRRIRDKIFLMASESHIYWAIGHRMSDASKVTEATKTVLCVRLHQIGEA